MTLIMYPRHGNSKCFSRTLFKHSQHAVTLRDFLSYSSCLKLNECTDQGSFQFLCTYVIFPTDGNRPAKWWKTGCESNICCALRDIVAGKLCYSGTGIGNKAGLSIDILNYNDTKFVHFSLSIQAFTLDLSIWWWVIYLRNLWKLLDVLASLNQVTIKFKNLQRALHSDWSQCYLLPWKSRQQCLWPSCQPAPQQKGQVVFVKTRPGKD